MVEWQWWVFIFLVSIIGTLSIYVNLPWDMTAMIGLSLLFLYWFGFSCFLAARIIFGH